MKYIILLIYIVVAVPNMGLALDITSNGLLNISSDPAGLKIYLDGDFIGLTPIYNYSVQPGEYTVSLFSSDTIEAKYWNLTAGSIGSKISTLWDLSKVGAATQKVIIKSNQLSSVVFSMRSINRAPTKAKLATACCIGTGFSVAFIIGFLVANLVK
jgi:hypothetical protein